MKRALIIQHVEREGLAGYRRPIELAGYTIEHVAAEQVERVASDIEEVDLVVVMGGPMGVADTADFPWLIDEIAVLHRRLAADRPTLGICLGSQLIAAALGAEVRKGPVWELGFGGIELTRTGQSGPLRLLDGVSMLHWHADTFNVPTGCELLATTTCYAQAFARGDNILALQFHAEMGVDPRFEQWLSSDAADIIAAGETPDNLRAAHARLGSAAVRAGQAMIAEWLMGLGAGL